MEIKGGGGKESEICVVLTTEDVRAEGPRLLVTFEVYICSCSYPNGGHLKLIFGIVTCYMNYFCFTFFLQHSFI